MGCEYEEREFEELIDFRQKPTREILREKMSILSDFGVFDRSDKDTEIRNACYNRLNSCNTMLGLEKAVQDIIRESFDRADLLMVN